MRPRRLNRLLHRSQRPAFCLRAQSSQPCFSDCLLSGSGEGTQSGGALPRVSISSRPHSVLWQSPGAVGEAPGVALPKGVSRSWYLRPRGAIQRQRRSHSTCSNPRALRHGALTRICEGRVSRGPRSHSRFQRRKSHPFGLRQERKHSKLCPPRFGTYSKKVRRGRQRKPEGSRLAGGDEPEHQGGFE
jgi:hypothetical protein